MPAQGAKHRTPWLVADSGAIRIVLPARARSNAMNSLFCKTMSFPSLPERRRLLALLLAGPAFTSQGAAPSATVLTVTGPQLAAPAASGRFAFGMAALQQLTQRTLVATTPWFKEAVEFSGPLLRDVLQASGMPAQAQGNLRCTALNDYRVEVPLNDVRRYDVVVAHRLNGKPMSVREKGPLFVIYPFDEQPELRTTTYYSRCIWQLKAIELV
jgi:hypothetical protein